MQYSAEEVADFEAQSGDDAAEPDRAEDIRPIFHKKGKGKGAKAKAAAAAEGAAEDQDDDDDDDDDNEEAETYTMRKRSAASLDKVRRWKRSIHSCPF